MIKITRSVSIELKDYLEIRKISEQTKIPENELIERIIRRGYEEIKKAKEK